MKVKEFLAKINATRNNGILHHARGIWELQTLRNLVPEGMVDVHPGPKRIAFIYKLDDGGVVMSGEPLESDRVRLDEVVELPLNALQQAGR